MRLIFLPILLLFFSGCVSGQIKPSIGSLYKVKKVAVVAMEAQPFEITTMSSKLTKHGVIDEPSFDNLITKNGAWTPTMMLTKEAAKDLMSTGNYTVIVDPTLQKYPTMEDRSRTYFLENWQSAIRKWYAQESPDYSKFKGEGVDVVLEVGLMSYGILNDKLLLQIATKLVDAETGRVIGRVREHDYPELDEDIFANNGENLSSRSHA
jgi:hypothetical protein